MYKDIRFFAAVVLLFVGFVGLKAQKQTITEGKQLFDYNWKFSLSDNVVYSRVDCNDADWRQLDLPHDWSIEGKTDINNPMKGAGGYFPAGIGWYRKTFNVPANWQGKRISVYFEGVYMNSEVFVNGKSVGIHPYGYTSFNYDVTPFLTFGKKNVIAVRVDNSQQINCRWYSGSGIYRHVWLNVTEPVHVAHWGVAITTPKAADASATVQVKTRIKNESNEPQRFVLSTSLKGINNSKAVSQQTEIEIPANSEKELTQVVAVLKPKLWSPETPYLYQAVIQIKKAGKPGDHQ